jgi:2-amino-4-hydroxy-6-hydroxymethyldihydropteridine diphosphokinase
VEWRVWAPVYAEIRRSFGFRLDRERLAASALTGLLRPADRTAPLARIGERLRGRDAVVVGLAPRAGAPPLWRLPAAPDRPVLLAADGATATCLAAGLVPTLVVTDLDGPVASEVAASGRGSLTVVHAHGDNIPALKAWVPDFPGELAGSWAGPPRAALVNVGGFTDGDRAAFLAEAAGARRVLLWGFDFEEVEEDDPGLRHRKLAKLAWARRALDLLARTSRVPILTWERDGSILPFPTTSAPPGPLTGAARRPDRRPPGRSRRSARTGTDRTRRSPPR